MTDPITSFQDDAYIRHLEAKVAYLERCLKGPDEDVVVLPDGVTLTPQLLRVVSAIIAGGGEPVPLDRIHAALYGEAVAAGKEVASHQTVRVMLSTLRRKLGDFVTIQNRIGFGYFFDRADILKLIGKEPWDDQARNHQKH